MNGFDSIAAVLTLLIILVIFPLIQFVGLCDELKYVSLSDATAEMGDDAAYIRTVGEILGIDPEYEFIGIEGKRNYPLYPYIFRDYGEQPDDLREGGGIFYGF